MDEKKIGNKLKNTGLLQPFIKLTKLGFGGRMGRGTQYISWIHEDDFVSVIEAAIEREDFTGTIHCSSSFPITNACFMKALRTSLKKSFGLPNPAFLIQVGSIFVRTEPELILTGRRVVSNVLEAKGIRFGYPKIEEALQDLVR
ncbi:MAG: DUF1731 domain-containing protein [Chitinophagaceae bacterium]|nr:DUF1731 domain-containing protein [Chitinophagaceae bacterium]